MRCFALLMIVASACPLAADEPNDAASVEKFELRYKFRPDEVIRWRVEQQVRVRTTVGGTTQTAETTSRSVKLWRVLDVADDGTVLFDHEVESIDMVQKLTGRAEVRYNSITDDEPPPEFAAAAQSTGRPLWLMKLDPHGKLLDRQVKAGGPGGTEQITLPLPDGAVPVGHIWKVPHEVDVVLEGGGTRKIKTQHRYVLEQVKNGIATVSVATQILSPVRGDARIESQLIQTTMNGTVEFDVEAGRVVAQQMESDEKVVGAAGPNSSMHYEMRFSEQLMPQQTATAAKPKAAGPAPPPPVRAVDDADGKKPVAGGRKRSGIRLRRR